MTDDKKCPDEYPIFFNGKCYKENDCPSGTNYLLFERQSRCNNKWYYDSENSLIICLDKNINCPNVYNYVVFTTNEYKINNDINYYEFNSMLYLNCSKDTIEIENDGVKKCICDKNKY